MGGDAGGRHVRQEQTSQGKLEEKATHRPSSCIQEVQPSAPRETLAPRRAEMLKELKAQIVRKPPAKSLTHHFFFSFLWFGFFFFFKYLRICDYYSFHWGSFVVFFLNKLLFCFCRSVFIFSLLGKDSVCHLRWAQNQDLMTLISRMLAWGKKQQLHFKK